MKCAIETWWQSGWKRCDLKATCGAYCAGHDWANRFPPFWNGGSVMGGSLIHRLAADYSASARKGGE